MPPTPRPRVALFITCLVDLMRPSVGYAAVKLLEDAGCTVEVPVQTCCGQPAYNSGDRGTTRDLAERMIEAFRCYDYVVAPSGSCAGMVRAHFPELFADDPNWLPKADALARRTYELTSFLVDVLGGTFAVKYADISNAIVEAKTHNIASTGAATVLAGDLGCCMNIAGKLSREGRPVAVRH